MRSINPFFAIRISPLQTTVLDYPLSAILLLPRQFCNVPFALALCCYFAIPILTLGSRKTGQELFPPHARRTLRLKRRSV